jgi:hypothetical protein
VIVVVKPPGDDVAVYDWMGEPPLFVGAVNETSAVVAPVRLAITLVGGPGLVSVAVAGVATNDNKEQIRTEISVKLITGFGVPSLILTIPTMRSRLKRDPKTIFLLRVFPEYFSGSLGKNRRFHDPHAY